MTRYFKRSLALILTALFILSVYGCTPLDKQDIEVVRKKAEAGDAEAQIELGNRYFGGKNITKNEKEAMKWFGKAAEQNNPEGECMLGIAYLDRGDKEDLVKAEDFFLKAALQNNKNAIFNCRIQPRSAPP